MLASGFKKETSGNGVLVQGLGRKHLGTACFIYI